MEKTILITGGTSGIGRAATELFAARGYRVFSTYRQEEDRASLSSIPGVHPLKLEVTSKEDLDRAFEEVERAVGESGLYGLINNAGIGYAAPFEYADEARGRQVMEVNLLAPFRIAQKFLPLLKRYGQTNPVKARVVNIASWAGQLAQPFIPFYNASKFGLVGMSESMFYDLGLVGVHVVLASPGTTRTPMLQKTVGSGNESLSGMPAEGKKRYAELLEHYAALGAQYGNSRLFPTPEKVALKLFRIIEKKRPSFKYNLAPDATFVDRVVARLPWGLKVAMNRRLFRLNAAKPLPALA